MAVPSRWFEYGDPGTSDRVPVVLRTTYETGSNEGARSDDVEFGSIPLEDLALLDEEPIAGHAHSDGSVLLSALPDDAEAELLANYESDAERQDLADLIDAGCSSAEAVDYLMTHRTPVTQVEWAERRGITQQTVSENVSKARDKLRDD